MNQIKNNLKSLVEKPSSILIGAFLLAFIPLLFGSLTAHDRDLISNEPSLIGRGSPFESFARSTPPRGPLGHYRPISTLSLVAEVDASQESAFLPRLSNLVLFFLISLVLFRLLKRLKLSPHLAAWSVALFVIHPTHVEVLATLAGRAPLAGHLFAVTAVLLSLRDEQTSRGRAAVFTLMLLSVLCQRSALTWCLVPLLIRYAEQGRVSWRQNTPRPMILGTLVALFLGFLATGQLWPTNPGRFIEAGSFVETIQSSLGVISKCYSPLMFNPSAMVPDAAVSNVVMKGWIWVVLGLIILSGLVVSIVKTSKTVPLFYLASWMLVLGLVPTLPIFDGDLPSQVSVFACTFFFPFFFGMLLQRFEPKLKKRKLYLVLPVLLAILCCVRSLSWHNDDILRATLPGAAGPDKLHAKIVDAQTKFANSAQLNQQLRAFFFESIDGEEADQRIVYAALLFELNIGRDFTSAKNLIEQLELERPNWPGLNSLKGQLAAGQHDPMLAHASFVNGRDHDDYDALSRWFLGVEYQTAGSLDLAEALWREGLAICTSANRQALAIKMLNQLGLLANRQVLDRGLFHELCRRQLHYNAAGGRFAKSIENMMNSN